MAAFSLDDRNDVLRDAGLTQDAKVDVKLKRSVARPPVDFLEVDDFHKRETSSVRCESFQPLAYGRRA
jgi:hypothetical protein